ncbi:IS1182 family transposase [Mariniplasma anaerobium]|uniref:Transposase n=1 Tax=Mariniplasma anaerobium TaxID=2735436 RepID=A0A7R7V9E5_9MOLU|nr:IS1182 family transposase [Mariniplasma anaerobium]BCR36798.1 transposase [Mariniplasma anaerobium]
MQSTQLTQSYFSAKQLKLPLEMNILIPFDSEVRTFDEVFSKIEVKKYLVSKSHQGRLGYNLVNMLKLVLFCQMEKIHSLRAMEKAAKNDIRLMWLTNELKPSHNTIKEFINTHLKTSIEDIFLEINQYIIKKEQIDINTLYIDGTKIEANANKYKFVWKNSILKFKQKLQLKITKTLHKLNEDYKHLGIYFLIKEDYEISYLEKIRDFLVNEIDKEGIDFVYGKGNHKSGLQRDYEDIVDYIEKLTSYNHDLEIIGPSRNSYARTDHGATYMRMKDDHMRNGQLKAGYNIQIGVSDGYIMHMDVYQNRSDYKTLEPFLEGFNHSYGFYPKYPVADAGYGGLINYRYLKSKDMELYQKYPMYKKETSNQNYINSPYRAENFTKDKNGNLICPKGRKMNYLFTRHNGKDVYESSTCLRYPLASKCKKGKAPRRIEVNEELWNYQKKARDNLQSDLGIELRIQHSIQVEGAFGVLKEDFKFRRFKRRGIQNVKLEFMLLSIGYNLSKYHNKQQRFVQ